MAETSVAPSASPTNTRSKSIDSPMPSKKRSGRKGSVAQTLKDAPATVTTNSKTNGAAESPQKVEKQATLKTPDSDEMQCETDVKNEKEDDSEAKTVEKSIDADTTAKTTEPAAEANGEAETEAEAGAVAKSNGSNRRRPSGVSEHKPKKLNRKKSKILVTHLDAEPGEYYFARLKSYPPWPAIICDEEMLPQSLLSTRPVTTRRPDGTFREGYRDGDKRVQERTFPVMFLQTNEFAWIPNTDLTPLKIDDVTEFAEKGKSKDLIRAYKVAAEQHNLQYFKELLADHQRALLEDKRIREERAAARAAKEERARKRKSKDAKDDDVDMNDADEGEEPVSKPKASRKRKKDADSDVESDKPAKTPKTSQKLKLTTPKTPVEKRRGARSTRKSVGKAASEETEEKPTRTPEQPKTISPQEELLNKEKRILYLRHRLQRGFLTRDQEPKEHEMADMDSYLETLETFPDLEHAIVKATKINKVLKGIIKLSHIPREQEFNFKERSHKLLNSWTQSALADSAEISHEHHQEKLQTKPKPEVDEDSRRTLNGDAATDKGEEAKPSTAKASDDVVKKEEETDKGGNANEDKSAAHDSADAEGASEKGNEAAKTIATTA